MAWASKTQYSNVVLDETGPHFIAHGGGVVQVGNARSRGYQLTAETAFPLGVQQPYYGTSTLVTVATSAGDIPAGTTISVREVFVNRAGVISNPGPVVTGPTLSVDSQFTITSTSLAAPFDVVDSVNSLIVYRQLYVAYTGTVDSGGYFLAYTTPYTETGDTTGNIDLSADALVQKRPLESDLARSIPPACSSAAYWRQRFWWGGQVTRLPLTSTLQFNLNSDKIILNGFCTFSQSDRYKRIVYQGSTPITVGGVKISRGMSFGAINLITDDVHATVLWDSWVNANAAQDWPFSNLTLTNDGTPADAQFWLAPQTSADVFYSSVYVGEAAQGLTVSPCTWEPLNIVRDENFWQAVGGVVWVRTLEDNLIICYERGVGIVYGDFSATDPMTLKMILVSDQVGSFNPNLVWHDKNGALWFAGSGRFWTVAGNTIVDASSQAGVASWSNQALAQSTSSMTEGDSSYDGTRNATLIVGLTKAGEETDLDYGAYLCHDRTPWSLHPIRFPGEIYTVVSIPATKYGIQYRQWYGGSRNYTYLIMQPNYFQDVTSAGATPVSYRIKTGRKVLSWSGLLRRFALSFEGGDSTMAATFNPRVSDGNDLAGTTYLPALKNFDRVGLNNMPSEGYFPLSGHSLGFEFSGTNSQQRLRIHGAQVQVHQTPQRDG
jgi:hypothetical protein